MMVDTVFTPSEQTYLVVSAALLIPSKGSGSQGQTYRVVNLSSSYQYLSWGNSALAAAAGPSAGSPATNTIGLLGSSVETFCCPPNVYFYASSATGFEVTPGSGP